MQTIMIEVKIKTYYVIDKDYLLSFDINLQNYWNVKENEINQ